MIFGHLWQSVALAVRPSPYPRAHAWSHRYGLGVAAFMATRDLPFHPARRSSRAPEQIDAPIALQPVDPMGRRHRLDGRACGAVEGVTPVLFTGDAAALHVAPVVAPAVPVAPVVTVSTETRRWRCSRCRAQTARACPSSPYGLASPLLLFRTGRDLPVERLVATPAG
jgi:hypothetical protein